MSTFAGVNQESINEAYISSAKARNNLTASVVDEYSGQYKHYAKVCCVCDRLIPYKKEKFVNIKKFEHINIQNVMNKDNVINLYDIPTGAFNTIKRQYTQNCFQNQPNLNQLILSPSSYGVIMERSKIRKLGCCDECFTGINRMTK